MSWLDLAGSHQDRAYESRQIARDIDDAIARVQRLRNAIAREKRGEELLSEVVMTLGEAMAKLQAFPADKL